MKKKLHYMPISKTERRTNLENICMLLDLEVCVEIMCFIGFDRCFRFYVGARVACIVFELWQCCFPASRDEGRCLAESSLLLATPTEMMSFLCSRFPWFVVRSIKIVPYLNLS
jgi:hypothetical protein